MQKPVLKYTPLKSIQLLLPSLNHRYDGYTEDARASKPQLQGHRSEVQDIVIHSYHII